MSAKKLVTFVLLICSLACSFTSCADSELYTSVMTMLGFDMNDYENEAAVRFPEEGDEIFGKVEDIVSILIYDSVYLTAFETTREAATGNVDAILNYMLKTSYSAYSGNSELLKEAEEAYPQYHITTLIPKGDYEGYVYRFFGGDSSVQHASSARFTYLSKLDAYTTTGGAVTSEVNVDITECVETAHTYRVTFTLTEGEETADYTSMFRKREDGTIYMKYLRKAGAETETAK